MKTSLKKCGSTGFNYCKWAKTIVAIPALPLIGIMAASFFTSSVCQFIFGIGAMIVAVAGAIWLDRIPLLMKKIRKIEGASYE